MKVGLIHLFNIKSDGQIKTQKEILASEIKNEGNDLSFGEKQLFCLARAILKDSKIFIIDEATSNLDEM